MSGVVVKLETRGINPPKSLDHNAISSERRRELLIKYLEIDKILHRDSVSGNSYLRLLDLTKELFKVSIKLENELSQELIERVDSYLIQKENDLKYDRGKYLDHNNEWVKTEQHAIDLKINILKRYKQWLQKDNYNIKSEPWSAPVFALFLYFSIESKELRYEKRTKPNENDLQTFAQEFDYDQSLKALRNIYGCINTRKRKDPLSINALNTVIPI